MLLENPVEPQVIKSTAKGILQHDAMSWQIEGPHFVSASLSESAISLHETLHNWLENIDENARTQFVDDLFSILESTGVDTLTQVQEGGLKNAAAMQIAKTFTCGMVPVFSFSPMSLFLKT